MSKEAVEAGVYEFTGVEPIGHGEWKELRRHITVVAHKSGSEPRLSFAEFLKELQRVAGISDRALGVRSGVDHATILRIKAETRTPFLSTAWAILGQFDLGDADIHRLIMDSVPERLVVDSAIRTVFSTEAPAVQGTFAEQLGAFRKARKLSFRALGSKSGIHRTTIWRMENDRFSVPALTTFAATAYQLGLNARQVRGLVRAA